MVRYESNSSMKGEGGVGHDRVTVLVAVELGGQPNCDSDGHVRRSRRERK